MKKKILSLVMCICIVFGGLFSFAGCSILKDNNANTEANQVVLTIDGKEIKRNSVLGSFYSFLYSNYSLIYGGYESSVIEEKFYNSVIKDNLILLEAEKALGTEIKYCEADEADVWENVESYFRSQVETYEKEIYDNDETKYPIWLKTPKAPEKDEFFENYEDPSKNEESEDKGAEVEKLTKEQIETEKYQLVFDAMFKYISHITLDENGEEVNHYEVIDEQEGAESRRTAFAKFMENAFLNAKAMGKVATQKELLLEQIETMYDSYYEAKLAELYENYIEKVLVLDADELKDESIVKLFLQTLEADKQNNKNEANYISVITSGKNEDTKVVLYHNNDKFFTVQHILLKFDDALIKDIQEEYLYVDMGSKDMQLEDFEQFVERREDVVSEYYNGTGVLTDVNTEQLDKFPTIKALLASGTDYDYYKYIDGEGYKTVDAENGKMMVTAAQTIDIYNKVIAKVNQSVNAVVFNDAEIFEQPEDIQYIIKAAQVVKELAETEGKSDIEIKKLVSEKVSSMVFYALTWIISDDGLYNTIYKQLGYVMANYPDDNNNFSHEFVGLSKDLFGAIKEGTVKIEELSVGNNTVITKDGLHIIKVENIFEEGASLIDVSGIDVTKTEDVKALMESTYVCNGSDQTLYDYYRDLVYNKLAGTDSANGDFFENYKNELLKKYLEEDKISYQNKLSYDEIMGSIY